MTETKHTPGPWEVHPPIRGYDHSVVSSCEAGFCAIADVPEQLTANEAPANARLIAAAPELLEALQSLLGWGQLAGCLDKGLRESIEKDPAWTKARAAIAKAEGGQA